MCATARQGFKSSCQVSVLSLLLLQGHSQAVLTLLEESRGAASDSNTSKKQTVALLSHRDLGFVTASKAILC